MEYFIQLGFFRFIYPHTFLFLWALFNLALFYSDYINSAQCNIDANFIWFYFSVDQTESCVALSGFCGIVVGNSDTKKYLTEHFTHSNLCQFETTIEFPGF